MQTKKMSMIETIISTTIGFIVSLILVNIVLPLYGFNVKAIHSVEITIIFTIASILRGYFVRRLFNFLNKKGLTNEQK